MSLLVVLQLQSNGPTGIRVRLPFDPKNPVHLARKHKCIVDHDGQSNVVPIAGEQCLTSTLSGVTRIGGFFETWVKKGTVIGEELSKSIKRNRLFETLDNRLGTFSLKIYAYDGEDGIDCVVDESDNLIPNIHHACTLEADLSGLQNFLKVQKTSAGQDFWRADYKVKILFGGTSLKARMTWYEGVSISRFHPHAADIWLCLSENPARRPR